MNLSLEDFLDYKSCEYDVDLVGMLNEPRYHVYVSTPFKITDFCNKFDDLSDSQFLSIQNNLTLFYLWMKKVDDEIDSGLTDGMIFLNRFNDKSYNSYQEEFKSSIRLTDALRDLVMPISTFGPNLEDLYYSVLAEQRSGSMKGLVDARIKSGLLISDLSLDIISLKHNSSVQYSNFLKFLGKFGNLVDTTLDLNRDVQDGEVSFNPNLGDRIYLYSQVGKLLVSGLTSYPFLINDGLVFLSKIGKDLFSSKRRYLK